MLHPAPPETHSYYVTGELRCGTIKNGWTMPGKSVTPQRPDFRSAVLLHNLRTVTPGILILPLVLAGLFWIQIYWPWSVGQDLQGTERRWGTGTIHGALIPTKRTDANGLGDTPNVLLKINGTTLPARANAPVQVGQKVRVTYRVGKSGRTYIQRISSLEAKN